MRSALTTSLCLLVSMGLLMFASGARAGVIIDANNMLIESSKTNVLNGSLDVSIIVSDAPVQVGSYNVAFNLVPNLPGLTITGATLPVGSALPGDNFQVTLTNPLADITVSDALSGIGAEVTLPVGTTPFVSLDFTVVPGTLGNTSAQFVSIFTQVRNNAGAIPGVSLSKGTISVTMPEATTAALMLPAFGLALMRRFRRQRS